MERCFEPGREILVYRTVGELNELYGRVSDDLGFARKVADAGYRRVVAEHTYSARMTTIARDLGLLGA